MSLLTAKQLLESRVNQLLGDLPIAWENVEYTPTDTAWQDVAVVFGTPLNPTFGDNFWRCPGFLQILLLYPVDAGTKAALQRVEEIRTAFPRGLTLISTGIRVLIDKTAEASRGRVVGGWYQLPVSVPFMLDSNV